MKKYLSLFLFFSSVFFLKFAIIMSFGDLHTSCQYTDCSHATSPSAESVYERELGGGRRIQSTSNTKEDKKSTVAFDLFLLLLLSLTHSSS